MSKLWLIAQHEYERHVLKRSFLLTTLSVPLVVVIAVVVSSVFRTIGGENPAAVGLVEGLNWQDALAYGENFEHAGYADWRLPDVKELQSILDYTRSPGTTGSAAIDPVFSSTGITIAPVVGLKHKIFDVSPFDKFLEYPQSVKKFFVFAGGYFGFPMSGTTVFSLELVYLYNSQAFFFVNGGLHFFL